MKRNAQISDYLVTFVPRIIFLIVVLSSIYFLVHSFIKFEISTFDAEADAFEQRLLYSRDGITFVDKDTGQLSAGIIDLSRLPSIEDDLKKSISYSDSRHLAARLKLTKLDGQEVSTLYFQREWFDRWIVASHYTGSGASKVVTKKLFVLLKDKYYSDIDVLQVKLNAMSTDLVAKSTEYKNYQDSIDNIKSSPKDTSLDPGYLEITVVIPNS